MNGAGEVSAMPARPWRAVVTTLLVLVLLAWLLARWWPAAAPSAGRDGGDVEGLGPLGAAALLAIGAIAMVVAGWCGAQLARHRLQPALHQAHDDRRALAQLIGDWYWETDAQHRLRVLRPPHAAPLTQWSGPPAQGRLIWDHYLPEATPAEALRARMDAGARFEAVGTRTGGSHGPGRDQWLLQGVPRHDADGRFVGYVGTARSIQADGPVVLAQELIDTLPLAACTIGGDAEAGRIEVRPNAAARALLELGDSPLGWREFLRALPTALRAAVEQASNGAPAGTDAPAPPDTEGWTVALHRVGRPAVLHVLTLEPPEGDGGRAAELALRDQESFSYTVSHDLRAPIRVVEGFARIVKEDYGRVLDRIGLDHLDRVLGAAARMNSMIDALLELSRLSSQPLSRQPVNLSQLTGYVIDDLRRHAPDREVEVMIAPGLTTYGDPTLLRIVLENLVGNAWKYTAKVKPAQIRFEVSGPSDRPVYTVRDNGAGFDMQFADRLFGVFQRLHSASDFQGTGVGLATVRRIVRRHGGEIWAEAEVGTGAAFHFTLKG